MINIVRSDGYRDDAHKKRNERIIEAINAYTEKHCATKETARAALIREGFLCECGKLMPQFGGPFGRLFE